MMNEIIKERLALIQSGTVPQGYKKTKFGIYPENWTLTFMGNCIREYREISNNIQEIPVYSSSRNGLLPQSEYYDGKEATQTNIGYKVVPPNYLTYRHMSDDDLFHFNMNETGGNILVSSEYPVFTVSDKAELGFILPLLNNTSRFKYFCSTQKLGGTRTRLYFKNLCEYQFYIPPLAEQKKIAEILEQWDAAIQMHSKLVEQLEKIKHAYFDLLFPREQSEYPKIRFGDFSGPWIERKLSDITRKIGSGKTPSGGRSAYVDLGIPLLRSQNITNNQVDMDDVVYIDSKTDEDMKNSRVQSGDVLLNITGASIGRSAVYRKETSANVNQHVCIIRPKQEFSPEFIQLLLSSSEGQRKINLSQAGGGRQGLNFYQIGEMTFRFPSIKEQEYISKFIESVESYHVLYSKKLNELREQKTGLMRLLLFGIVRVKV